MKKTKKQMVILFVMGVILLFPWHIISIAKTMDEENNISIYHRMGPGVVNITSVVVERDFFYNPIPK